MIRLLMLVVVPFAYAAATLVREQDPLIISIGDVDGVLYEVPEYEDPQMIEHELSSFGAMPLFTLLNKAKKAGNSKEGEALNKAKIAEAKESIDDVIEKLRAIESKLDKGSLTIYSDIEKSIQSLKTLEKKFRPDFSSVISSLKASMSLSRPIAVPNSRKYPTTIIPAVEETVTFGMPEGYDLGVKVLPGRKALPEEKTIAEEKPKSVEVTTTEEVIAIEEKTVIAKPKSLKSDMVDAEAPKAPIELEPYKKTYKKVQDERTPNVYQSEWNWQIADA